MYVKLQKNESEDCKHENSPFHFTEREVSIQEVTWVSYNKYNIMTNTLSGNKFLEYLEELELHDNTHVFNKSVSEKQKCRCNDTCGCDLCDGSVFFIMIYFLPKGETEYHTLFATDSKMEILTENGEVIGKLEC